ncbi:hypothetical protein A8B75_11595 [Sphingomonadales bacterium EhC05]|nr:hypothetical protein A8B75_11595 [Sphingomonadales bacterium EhC05]
MNWKREAALIEQSHNVERLPTAAPRQVKNNQCKAQRQARIALKERHASRFNYRLPSQREALKKASIIRSLNPTPELLIVEEFLNQQGRDVIAKMRDGIVIKQLENPNNPVALEQAVAFLSVKIPTFGERVHLNRAFAELEAEDSSNRQERPA